MTLASFRGLFLNLYAKTKTKNFRNRCSQRKCQSLADGEDQASERAPLASSSQLPCVTVSLQLDPISELTFPYKTLKMGVSSEQPRRADPGQLLGRTDFIALLLLINE